MKKLLIALVSVMATVAFANEGAATTAPAAPEQKTEMPKDAAHAAPSEHHDKKAAKAEKKAKKNKKAKEETK